MAYHHHSHHHYHQRSSGGGGGGEGCVGCIILILTGVIPVSDCAILSCLL